MTALIVRGEAVRFNLDRCDRPICEASREACFEQVSLLPHERRGTRPYECAPAEFPVDRTKSAKNSLSSDREAAAQVGRTRAEYRDRSSKGHAGGMDAPGTSFVTFFPPSASHPSFDLIVQPRAELGRIKLARYHSLPAISSSRAELRPHRAFLLPRFINGGHATRINCRVRAGLVSTPATQ